MKPPTRRMVLSSTEREALRIARELTPKAMRRLGELLDFDDPDRPAAAATVQMGAAKALLDVVSAKERFAAEDAVEELMSLPPAERARRLREAADRMEQEARERLS